MNGNKRNFSLSIWDHKDNFLCLLKSPNEDINGQSYDEDIVENIYGEKILTFSIPAYIFNYEITEDSSKDNFIKNEKWDYIFNEQKVRYIEYKNNEPSLIQEFVLKNHTESREGYEKTIQCQCESLAIYELSKKGWGITFNTDYITPYETKLNSSELLTIDYWLKKIFYKETHLGRVSTTTECTYLLQGMQLRDENGAPISNDYTIDKEGNYKYLYIEEPICDDESSSTFLQYYNPTGWTWETKTLYKNNPNIQSTTTVLYEEPTITVYNEVYPNQYKAFSYQEKIDKTQEDAESRLRPHPIALQDYGKLQYVTHIKKRLIQCERSNIFSIIQTLCETFGVWAYFNYKYNNSGKIIERKINFKTEAINDKIKFDFSYGKNLLSASRIIDSNELITKLTIPNVQSSLDSERVLSIQQATANPTGENYIYNFEYFYNLGTMTRGEDDENSDEYKINLYNGTIKSYNNAITRLQNNLVPLYDRQGTLEGDLSVQQASYTGIVENIQSIQDKIDAIPASEREIQCWSDDNNQWNHVGELKTISTTTINGANRQYIDFGREDILYNKDIEVITCSFNDNELINGVAYSVNSYIPRYCANQAWQVGNDISDSYFIRLDTIGTPIYTDKNQNYIKGFIINSDQQLNSYIRVRYKYAPLAYYYSLMREYYNKLIGIKKEIEKIENDLQYIKNKILVCELNLNNILTEKNNRILEFEKKYKNFIKEGYWEPNNYQSNINPKQLDTSNTTSKFEGLITINTKLSDLNLNDSLNNYSYYINLNVKASQIDIDSISMTTSNPTAGVQYITTLPRYKGNDYEVFIDNNDKVILGISPTLIDSYKTHEYSIDNYKSTVSFSTNGQENKQEYDWIIVNNNVIVKNKYIYLTNDNILTNSIQVYGNSIEENNLLTLYEDYDYLFDYAGYDYNGHRVPLDEQTSYSDDIRYDYIVKIILKNTNKVNQYNNFTVTYNEENTLQFLYNDAIKTSEKYAVPQITYSVSVLDISSLNGYSDYKPILGQKVPIYDIEMGLNGYEGIITSVSRNLERPQDTNIEIATYQSRFQDIFQKLTATMTEVKYNENEIMQAVDSFNSYGAVKEEVFQKSLDNNNYKIQLGTNNDIIMDKKSGITLVDQNNYSAVKLIGNGVFLTDNYIGDNSQWKTGITGNGINANALITGNIDTKNINIWNASEGQIRFIWNEQGLFAYGAKGISGESTSTKQDFVDYEKYVKFNYDGLNFSDNGKSALSLGWNGLAIDTQQGALRLDADDGLVLHQNTAVNSVKRLELGKLDDGNLYGLKLYDLEGKASFQSDSDGNLWLSKHIKVGGQYDSKNKEYTSRPTAGIVGLTTSNAPYQMGVMRDPQTGNVIFNTSQLRFWAGPQTKQQYLSNLYLTSDDVKNLPDWNNISDFDPSLARFKVDASGNIVASGIDVGGWIGAGKILKSKNNEAILRSDEYNNKVYPVIAIGKASNKIDGTDYNFRVYQDGTVYINKGNIHIGNFDIDDSGNVSLSTSTFKTGQNGTYLYTQGLSTTPNGTSLSTNGLQTGPDGTSINTSTFNTGPNGTSLSTNTFNVNNQAANLIAGSVAGWTATKDSLQIVTPDNKNGTYMFATTATEGFTFVSGPKNNPNFMVQNNGHVTAKDLTIQGGSIQIIDSGLISNSTGTSLSGSKSSVNIGGLIASSTQTSLSTPSFKTDMSTSTYLLTGEVAGWTATTTGLEIIISSTTTTYKTAMYSKKDYSATTFQSGPSTNPTFVVKNDGSVKADNIKITGDALSKSTDLIIDANNTFKVTKEGKVTATAGDIAGWNISSSTLSTTIKVNNKNYYEGIQKPNTTTDIVFYAGDSKTTPKFRVLADGTLYAQDAVISGTVNAKVGGEIAGFIIGEKALWNGKSTSTSGDSGVYIGNDAIALGSYSGDSPAFMVDKNGHLEAHDIKITGAKSNVGYETKVLEFTNANNEVIFSVTKGGTLDAKKGRVAGWNIDNKSISNSTIVNNVKYSTGMEIPQEKDTKVFYAGTNEKPEFYVKADGTVIANKLEINSGTLGNKFESIGQNITNLSTDISNNIDSLSTNINAKITGLADSRMELWYYEGDPSSVKKPEKDWLNPDIRNIHIDDLYFNINSGEAFRYTYNQQNNIYKWEPIPEYSVSAQQLANQAQATADKKRTVFTSQPTVPYDIGDLWVKGNEIWYANQKRTTGNYTASEWTLTATDDTTANTAKSIANSTIKYEEQLWFATDSATIPEKPNTKITQNGNVYKQWTLTVPSSNIGYPYYYYCFQRETADGTMSWSNVSYDSHSVGGFLADNTGLQLQKLNNYYIGMQPPANKAIDDVVIYAGTKGKALDTNEFVVKANGTLKATNAEIVGNISASTGYIGGNQGFTIVNKSLYSGKSSLTGTANGVYIGTDGISIGSSSKYFRANANGTIEANGLTIKNGSISIAGFSANSTDNTVSLSTPSFITNSSKTEFLKGNISGWSATGDRLQIIDSTSTYGTLLKASSSSTGIAIQAGNINNPAFTIKNNGDLYASNANIAGYINATSGKIGGWNITTNYIHARVQESGEDRYYIGMRLPSTSTNTVFYAGSKGVAAWNNEFVVRADGYLRAVSGEVAGWRLDPNYFYNYLSSNTGNCYVGLHKPSTSNDIVFYAGTKGAANINNEFWVKANGEIKATGLTLSASNISDFQSKVIEYAPDADVSTIGGFSNTNNTSGGLTAINGNYKVGLRYPNNSSTQIIYAGTYGPDNTNNPFYVRADGYLKATSGTIGGWEIMPQYLRKINNNYVVELNPQYSGTENRVIYIGNKDHYWETFSVSGMGNIYFNGTISAWYDNAWRTGVLSNAMTLYDINGNIRNVRVVKGLIVDIS